METRERVSGRGTAPDQNPRWESVRQLLGNERHIKRRGAPRTRGCTGFGALQKQAQSRLRSMDCVPNVVGQLKAGESLAWFLLLKGALVLVGRGRVGAGTPVRKLEEAQGQNGLSPCGWVWW